MGMVCLAPGGGWDRVLPSSSCIGINKLSKSCSSCHHSFSPNSSKLIHGEFGRRQCFRPSSSKSRRGIGPSGDPQSETVLVPSVHEDEDVIGRKQLGSKESKWGNNIQSRGAVIGEAFLQGNSAILSACIVGLLTGITVVLFNNAVHEIRDFFWDGLPSRGASWLRDEPVEVVWVRVITVPVCGGLIVGLLNVLRVTLDGPAESVSMSNLKAVLEPILKTMAACITLGTGNSLGPEGPSVEIGASIAKGVGSLFDRRAQRKLSLVAAGSAAGISSGFNAAVAGCFFAVESVLWPSSAESSSSASSLANATSMVILSAVIASVVSEIGLGSEPAFTVPEYDFRSASELPLYLLLGILCGLVSLTLSRCTSLMLVTVENAHKTIGIPKAIFPILGGLSVGLIALAYPEILYWGFDNVDILLESRPFVKGLSADLLLQLVAVKIVATSLCRASGLVGGYYAPSLFIGAATGMAYGKFIISTISQSDPIFHLSFLEVASPQAYGLDYRIVLPLLGAVGFSSWITSGHTSRTDRDTKNLEEGSTRATIQPEISSYNLNKLSFAHSIAAKPSNASDLCNIESSLSVDDSNDYTAELERQILVSHAMRTRFVTVLLGTLLTEAVNLMLAEKQSCAVIVDESNFLIGLLTLGEIEEFSKSSNAKNRRPEEVLVSEVCAMHNEKCQMLWTVTPGMNLFSARMIMNRHGVCHLPVIIEHVEDQRGLPVGLLDRECIILACRVLATRECFGQFP
ncbi:chloride channel protein CLC-e isoform X2 [Rhododendron vialii]|uniref:chloride channel protein CLC-e isoform X2 n=1 Tax=Rhododendron vialii TaxID=182163 RepID=UPI00265FCFAC|nr:chloride channel protein CLC-e isoform X2 [Rhododendron vialii]